MENNAEVAASAATATTDPRVSSVQYIRKRVSFGRADGTRQIRLKACSMLHMVSRTDASKATTPVLESATALWAKPWRYCCTERADDGTKFANRNSVILALQTWKSGKAENTANTTAENGTSANMVVYARAPADSKQRSSTNRFSRNRLNRVIRSRSISEIQRRSRFHGDVVASMGKG